MGAFDHIKRLNVVIGEVWVNVDVTQQEDVDFAVWSRCQQHGAAAPKKLPVLDFVQFGLYENDIITVFQCPRCATQSALRYKTEAKESDK